MDPANRFAACQTRDRDHAGPASATVVISEVRMKKEVWRARIPQPARMQIRLSQSARQGHTFVQDATDFQAVVGACWRCWSCWQVTLHTGQTGSLIKEAPFAHARGVVDHVYRPRAFAGREVEAPTCVRPIKMDDTGALTARTAPGKIGAPHRAFVMGQLRLRKKRRQPIVGRGREPRLDGGQVMSGGGDEYIVEIDHGPYLTQGARDRAPRG